MPKITKKFATAALTGAIVVGGAGAALAYWTSNGSGAGSATTGKDGGFTVVVDSSTLGDLTPGGATDTVTFHVTNAGDGVQKLQSAVAKVANSDGTAWTAGSGDLTCTAADFSVSATSVTLGEMASGATVDGSFTIKMTNRGVNQDGCKNISVPLYVSAG